MNITTNQETHFIRAWQASVGDDFASRMARVSLEASARQDANLSIVVDRLIARNQVELDLHLDGIGVYNHQTNALAFADFIRGIADSVKEISKVVLGRNRLADSLLISALAPGSVRVVLRAAPPELPQGVDLVPGVLEEQSVDSRSLALVAELLSTAQESSLNASSALLDEYSTRIPPAAKSGVMRAAKVIKSSGWTVSGTLKQPDVEPQSIEISTSGASRLVQWLGDVEQTVDTEYMSGIVDGQRRSKSTMWFSPNAGKSFEASVPTSHLLKDVADIAALGEVETRAAFKVTTRYTRGEGSEPKRSYSLVSIVASDRDEVEELPTASSEP